MTYTISVRITGKPVPKGRPRFSKFGGVYTPATTVEYENRVADAWREQRGDLALTGQLEAFLYFGTVGHVKQDIDNLVKSALDGLQRAGAFVNGDEQVYKITASKFPATREEQHTIIVLRPYDYTDTA
jgi:crossover junction endodeoxyribonuclease RusA